MYRDRDLLGDIMSIQFLDIDRINVFTNHTSQSRIIGQGSNGIMIPDFTYQSNNLRPWQSLYVDL